MQNEVREDGSTGRETVLTCRGLTKEFTRRTRLFTAVDNVDFSLRIGEFAAIVGKSGNGKSTLLTMIAGLLSSTHGLLKVCGHEISAGIADYDMCLLRAQCIGFVSQTQTLLANVTVFDNVLMPSLILRELLTNNKSNKSTRMRDERSVDDTYNVENYAHDLLVRLHIDDLASCYPKELSGGEMRRVMIARALINRPKLVILDEPTSDLDTFNTRIVMGLLKDLAKQGTAVLMVTHDKESAESADAIYRMDRGQLTKL